MSSTYNPSRAAGRARRLREARLIRRRETVPTTYSVFRSRPCTERSTSATNASRRLTPCCRTAAFALNTPESPVGASITRAVLPVSTPTSRPPHLWAIGWPSMHRLHVSMSSASAGAPPPPLSREQSCLKAGLTTRARERGAVDLSFRRPRIASATTFGTLRLRAPPTALCWICQALPAMIASRRSDVHRRYRGASSPRCSDRRDCVRRRADVTGIAASSAGRGAAATVPGRRRAGHRGQRTPGPTTESRARFWRLYRRRQPPSRCRGSRRARRGIIPARVIRN